MISICVTSNIDTFKASSFDKKFFKVSCLPQVGEKIVLGSSTWVVQGITHKFLAPQNEHFVELYLG